MKWSKIISLVVGIIVLIVSLLVFAFMAGLNALSESDRGKTNYEYEQESRAASSKVYADLNRSLFTTVVINQGSTASVSLVPTEAAWKEQQQLIDELNKLENVEYLGDIYLQDPNQRMELVYELSGSTTRSEEPCQGLTDEDWRTVFSQLETADGNYLRLGGTLYGGDSCSGSGALENMQIDGVPAA